MNLLRPLRVRDFRLLFGGESISVLGDHFHFVALAWLTLQLTGSGLALGSVLMVAAIPRTVFILLGGALSDRFSPRSLMLYSNAFRAVLVGILAVLVLTGNAQLWQLFVFAGIFGVVDALFYPAVNSILPMLVDEPALPPANALLQGSQQLAGLIGPALAGLLIASFQIGTAFVVDAVSFAIAATAVSLVLGGRRAGHAGASSGSPRPSLLGTISAGLRVAWSDPAVRSLILLTAAFNFAFNGPLLVGLPFLARNSLGGGSATFGILLSAFGAGSLLGAAGAGSVGRVRRLGAIVLTIAIGMGGAFALLGAAPNVASASALLAAIGVGAGFVNVHIFSWLQSRTAEDMRGRVMSMVMLGAIGLAPVSYALAGAVVDLGAATIMFATAGAIVVAASLLGFTWGVAGRMTYAPLEAPEPSSPI
ncbi:MAG: MFS transporter [Chloroflexota bacterium]|nr:MFS transporter [Chloroflexota bacterium]